MRTTGLLMGTLMATGSLLTAPAMANESDGWTVSVTPYFFGASIDATTGIGSVETEIDMSASDVLDRFDSGFMAMLSARKGSLLLGLDASYFSLKDEESTTVTGPFQRATLDGTVEVTSEQSVYQPMVGYRVIDTDFQLDVYGGARYTRMHDELELIITTTIPSFPGGSRSAHYNFDWTDVVAGIHPRYRLSKSLALEGMADVGAGDNSDGSYQLMGTVSYQVSDRITCNLGYRIMRQKYDKDDLSWDATYSGVLAGMSIAF